MKITDQSGHTLIEILLASLLIGMIFVMITSLYVTSLKFLNGDLAAKDIEALIAFETLQRSASLASDGIVDMAGAQVKLRIDFNDPGTATTADDTWISYCFLTDPDGRIQLRSRQVDPPNASPANVVITDPEVVSGLQLANSATLSRFGLVFASPTVLEIELVTAVPANGQMRTYLTRTALRKSTN